MARIEVREFVITGPFGIEIATHQFLVKHNDDGTRQELHGVAIDPNTRQFNPVAIAKGQVLKVAAHPPIPSHNLLTIEGFNSLYEAEQGYQTLLNGTQADIDARWDAAIQAAELINEADDWKYELKGGGHNDSTAGNSNSVVATLENIMGFSANKIAQNLTAPGLEKNLLPQADFGDLYNAAWGGVSAYEPDGVDVAGKSMAAALTNLASSDCLIS